MADHPMQFQGWSVRGILAQRKTQTRRPMAPRNSLIDGSPGVPYGCSWEDLDWEHAWVDGGPSPAGNPGPYLKVPLPAEGTTHRVYSRIQPGDVLWVREKLQSGVLKRLGLTWSGHTVQYEATGEPVPYAEGAEIGWCGQAIWQWKRGVLPARFMPRWASRLNLEVLRVWPQRVRDITEEDAESEGVDLAPYGSTPGGSDLYCFRTGFRQAWDTLWADRDQGWEDNQWIWAYEFDNTNGR